MKKRVLQGLAVVLTAIAFLWVFDGYNSRKKASEEQSVDVTEKSDLASLIVRDKALVPGDGLEWDMAQDAFLEICPGAERLDPESPQFEEYRRGEMPNGMVSLSPPVAAGLYEYNAVASPTFLFDENSSLSQVAWRIVCPVEEVERYAQLFAELAEDADGIDFLTRETGGEISQEELLENPVSVKWDTVDRSASFQMNSVCFQENFLLELIVSVRAAK